MQNDHYSFIVRIWREAEDREHNHSTWRGSIDDVSSNKRLYFNDLDGIIRFIEEQVGSMTGKAPLHWTTRFAREGGRFLSSLIEKLTLRRLWKRHEKR